MLPAVLPGPIEAWPFPTLDDVHLARANIAPFLSRTPTHRYAGLDELLSASVFVNPQRILWQLLDDFDLVSDTAIRVAQRLMIEHTRNLIESSGSAPLAAALRRCDELQGKRVGLIASGGNVAISQLRELLAA